MTDTNPRLTIAFVTIAIAVMCIVGANKCSSGNKPTPTTAYKPALGEA